MGKRCRVFPLEPMAAKAIIAAGDSCAEDTISVLSMLATDSVFRQHTKSSAPVGQRDQSRTGAVREEEGDHVTLLEVFRAFRACGMAPKKWCTPTA